MIERKLKVQLIEKLNESKLVLIRGVRRAGKETLLRSIFDFQKDTLFFGDCSIKSSLKSLENETLYHEFFFQKKTIIVKEAQLLTNLQKLIEFCLSEHLVEHVILLCSFEATMDSDLKNALIEQGLELEITPISYEESANCFGLQVEDSSIEKRLIFGYFPEIVEKLAPSENQMNELLDTVIHFQLGANDRINKRESLYQVLRVLAWNMGKVLSFNEIALQANLDNETAERYVKLFEKADLLHLIPCFHSEQRYELKKSHVVYFTDNGIRNALLRMYQDFEFRLDQDVLWKNWVISERMKVLKRKKEFVKVYFWMTHTKQVVDWVEDENGTRSAYKIQWDKKKKLKIPALFQTYYPDIKVSVVNRSTFWSFLMK